MQQAYYAPRARRARRVLEKYGGDEQHRLLAALNRIAQDPVRQIETLAAWKFLTRDPHGRLHLVAAHQPTTEAIFAFDDYGHMLVNELRLVNGKRLTPRNVAEIGKIAAALH